MAANPFISARVSSELLQKLEFHACATGESKSKILVNALVAYLDEDKKLEIEAQNHGIQ